jgi:YegS/Rv2252/BmrU family lipid kinase
MKKMLMVYNPHAGKAQIRSNLLDIIDVFSKAGYEVTVIPTQKRGDAVQATYEKAGEYEVVVCCGGDGTLDETVTGMMQREKRVPVGYVPAGSTNDFATSLNIPKTMRRAAEVIVRRKEFACDIGNFNKDTFVYIAAFGLFTKVSYETKQKTKNAIGHMAYVLEGMKSLTVIPSYQMKVTYVSSLDSKKEIEISGKFIFGMITNSISVAGLKKITGKDVTLDDGLFEVMLVKEPKNPMELNQLLLSLSTRKSDEKCMYCFKSSKVKVESDKRVAWTLDGEFGGNHKKVTIKNEKRALNIIVP